MVERRSALAGRYFEGEHGAVGDDGPGLELRERRGLALLQLDGPGEDQAFQTAVREALGFDLPLTPGTSKTGSWRAALWTGPNRWTIRAPEAEAGELAPKLKAAYEGRHGALIELGQARTVIRIAGRNARDVLGKGCPLDLHPRVFPLGACGTSQVATVAVQIHHVEEGVFDLSVFRSFGLHLWEWLEEVGAEYGYRVDPVTSG